LQAWFKIYRLFTAKVELSVHHEQENLKLETMNIDTTRVSPGGAITLLLVIFNAILLREAYTSNESLYYALIISLPLLGLNIYSFRRKKHTPPGKSQRNAFEESFSEEGRKLLAKPDRDIIE